MSDDKATIYRAICAGLSGAVGAILLRWVGQATALRAVGRVGSLCGQHCHPCL